MKNIVLLCGGRSAEHEISLLSTAAVMKQLDKTKFRVSVVGIGRDGKTLPEYEVRKHLDLEEASLAVSAPDDWVEFLSTLDPQDVVVFPVLHGPYGEDGTVQGLLEVIDLPYVGAGVGPSAVGMNKIYSKAILGAEGLPVLPGIQVTRSEWNTDPGDVIQRAGEEFSYPVFVKPANMGSSVGVNKSRNETDLRDHVALAFQYDDYVLLEPGIEAREFEVSVLGSFTPRASVPGEIVPDDEFYSYEAKYLSEGSRLLIPAPLEPEATDELRRLAVRGFQALQLEGMARVDFLMDKTTGEIWINEPNTIPGFTRISMYPKLWEESGLGYSELLEELIRIGWERYRRRKQLSVER